MTKVLTLEQCFNESQSRDTFLSDSEKSSKSSSSSSEEDELSSSETSLEKYASVYEVSKPFSENPGKGSVYKYFRIITEDTTLSFEDDILIIQSKIPIYVNLPKGDGTLEDFRCLSKVYTIRNKNSNIDVILQAIDCKINSITQYTLKSKERVDLVIHGEDWITI